MGLRRGPSVTAHADQRTLNYRHRDCWFMAVASDTTVSGFACRRSEVYVSPGAAPRGDENVGQQAGVAAVAVGPGMDHHHAVVQAHGDFGGSVGGVFLPVAGIVKQRAHALGDAGPFPTEVAVAGAVLAGPPPDLVEHAPVQFAGEGVGEQIGATQAGLAQGPQARGVDVETFGGVELRAGGEAGAQLPFLLLGEGSLARFVQPEIVRPGLVRPAGTRALQRRNT
jgi:hypothetical protein